MVSTLMRIPTKITIVGPAPDKECVECPVLVSRLMIFSKYFAKEILDNAIFEIDLSEVSRPEEFYAFTQLLLETPERPLSLQNKRDLVEESFSLLLKTESYGPILEIMNL